LSTAAPQLAAQVEPALLVAPDALTALRTATRRQRSATTSSAKRSAAMFKLAPPVESARQPPAAARVEAPAEPPLPAGLGSEGGERVAVAPDPASVAAPPVPWEIAQQIERLEKAIQRADEISQRGRESSREEATAEITDPAGNRPAPGATVPPGVLPPPEAVGHAEVRRDEGDNALVINIQDSDIRKVLELLSQQGGLNILASPNVTGKVSASLTGVDVDAALQAILRATGYVARRDGSFIYVGTQDDLREMDQRLDRISTRVYQPDYVRATELQLLVTPLLTPGLGMSSVTSPAQVGIAADGNAAGGNDFAGHEVLLVRDYEAVLLQVDQIVADVDCQPLQVAIEAMILSVSLNDAYKFGVNFELFRDKNNVRLISGTPLGSLANINVSEGGLKFGFLDSTTAVFIEALETIGDTNVVAAPRLMCLNKQRAEILIGSQLGYVSTTVTENAATQAVEFLEVGTQLRLRPFISRDGMIRLEVHPELSTGNVRIEEGFTLPDKEVTQVTTNILCPDGETVVIGGLIREDVATSTSQIPLLGSLPVVGVAFRQKKEETDRREIIVLLTPHIVHPPQVAAEGQHQLQRFSDRRRQYLDGLSPLPQTELGRKHYQLALEAWQAGNLHKAVYHANLAVHYDPLNQDAVAFRTKVLGLPIGLAKPIDAHTTPETATLPGGAVGHGHPGWEMLPPGPPPGTLELVPPQARRPAPGAPRPAPATRGAPLVR